ncbi:hypothetical protein WKI68_41875 [Streptomyces sp. MS1.HAVA.3]|uniref:Lipoprotein n=1 Tax=Streptomyces caledonius TaxID=3134107 RepID=A0ABU8UDN8_9ACTN
MRVWTNTTMRACLASALGGAVVLSAAGCSPALHPLAAVYVDQEGTAHALLRPCDDDDRVRGPGLRGTVVRAASEATSDGTQDTAPEASPAEEPWIGWETHGLHEAADFPLFAPPSGWAAEVRGPQSLQPGYSYELAFADPDDDYAYNGAVTFDPGNSQGCRPERY